MINIYCQLSCTVDNRDQELRVFTEFHTLGIPKYLLFTHVSLHNWMRNRRANSLISCETKYWDWRTFMFNLASRQLSYIWTIPKHCMIFTQMLKGRKYCNWKQTHICSTYNFYHDSQHRHHTTWEYLVRGQSLGNVAFILRRKSEHKLIHRYGGNHNWLPLETM